MTTWQIPLPAGKSMIFEVVGKESSRTQFSRIKCGTELELDSADSVELSLGETIGERVIVQPEPKNRMVVFTPYNYSESGVSESDISVKKEKAKQWILSMEDSPRPIPPFLPPNTPKGDYNDYIVRASIELD